MDRPIHLIGAQKKNNNKKCNNEQTKHRTYVKLNNNSKTVRFVNILTYGADETVYPNRYAKAGAQRAHREMATDLRMPGGRCRRDAERENRRGGRAPSPRRPVDDAPHVCTRPDRDRRAPRTAIGVRPRTISFRVRDNDEKKRKKFTN